MTDTPPETLDAPPATTFEILRRMSRSLSARLTDDEIGQRGRDLARAWQDIASEEVRQDGLKKEMKARLSGLSSEAARLATIVSRGEELRDVDVEVRAVIPAGVVHEIRMDTGEIIHSRPFTDTERQRHLPLGDAPMADAAPPASPQA